MTFHDLPPNPEELPISTPGLAADLVDLLLSYRGRADQSLLLLPVDADERPVKVPMIVRQVPWTAPYRERRRIFEVLAHTGARGVVVATSRRWGRIMPDDLAWRESAEQACTELGLELHGFYVATTGGVFELPGAPARARVG